jgi:antitoxin component YwqK of YwqJK toxin-antitoxin module
MRYWYYENNGILKSCNHINGLRQGPCINYNKDGTIKSVWNYVDDKIEH